MARGEKNTVDYFPFLCKESNAMSYINSKYGNDGYATWVRILRELAVTNYHFIRLDTKINLMFFSNKCNLTESLLFEIINDLVELEEFDRKLWENNKIIWCQKFIDNIQDAYIKRKNECISYNSLLLHLDSLGILKLPKSTLNESKSTLQGDRNTHIIEDNTIIDNKIKKTIDKSIVMSEKRNAFRDQLQKFLDLYGKDMLNEFYKYWIEPNKSGTKMRYELERTWELKLRLQRWAGNQTIKSSKIEQSKVSIKANKF